MNEKVKCNANSCRTCTAICHRHITAPMKKVDALALVRESFDFSLPSEEISIENALGRVTAKPSCSAFTIPRANVSQHDGIMVIHDVVISHKEWPVRLHNGEYALAGLHTPVDAPWDTIIPSELFDFDGNDVLVRSVPATGGGIVHKGSSFSEGDVLIPAGHKLNAANLSLLRFAGRERITVLKKPKCIIIPTGNGIVHAGEIPGPGQSIESNSLLIKLMIEECGGEAEISPIIPNDLNVIENALKNSALSDADFIVTIGSAGTGRANFNDYIIEAIEELGTILVQGVYSIPGGKPLFFAKINEKPVIGIPGPPHAALTQTVQFIPSIMENYMGVPCLEHTKVQVLIPDDYKMPISEGMSRRCRLTWNGTDYVLGKMCGGDNAEYFVECEGVVFPDSDKKPGDRITAELVYGERTTKKLIENE